MALGAAGLFAGYLQYIRKEGISRPVPFAGAGRLPLRLVIGTIVGMAVAFTFVIAVRVRHVSGPKPALEAPTPTVVGVPGVPPPSTRAVTTSAPAARKE